MTVSTPPITLAPAERADLLAALAAHQRVAIEAPCLLAEETIRPRFGHRRAGRATLVFSLNAGYE